MATTNIGRESELHSRLGARVHADMLEAIIIGAGFGGIGMARSLLKRRGINRFVILEKARTVGGVWRDNVYPGAACDVPSHLYSFSFAPNPNWSRTFAVQSEIHAYLEQCADVLGIRDHVALAWRFAAPAMTSARIAGWSGSPMGSRCRRGC